MRPEPPAPPLAPGGHAPEAELRALRERLLRERERADAAQERAGDLHRRLAEREREAQEGERERRALARELAESLARLDAARGEERRAAGETEPPFELERARARLGEAERETRLHKVTAMEATQRRLDLEAQLAALEGRLRERDASLASARADAQRLERERRAALADGAAQAGRARELAAELEELRRSRDAQVAQAREYLRQLQARLDASEAARGAAEAGRKAAEASADDARQGAARSWTQRRRSLRGRLARLLDSLRAARAATVDPGWLHVLASLEAPLASARGQLRKLAGLTIAETARAASRAAAASLSETQLMLRAASVYWSKGDEKLEALRLAPLAESVLQAWEPRLRARGIAVVWRLEARSDQARARPEALRVVLYQLVRNAYEAMPAGGCLTVRLWRAGEGRELCLSLSDTGAGFKERDPEEAFKPFAKARKGHAGLGLALARRVLERLGGAAEAGATPSGGASVRLRFPAKTA
ncbi:MAG: hypothetical protein HY554_19570 [Elusimicrobia bacterium]|nr:hypothetical protein [Elusimicrobiota bacterium]